MKIKITNFRTLITAATCTVAIVSTLLLSGCSPLMVVGTAAGTGAFFLSDRRSASKVIEDQALEMKITDSIYGDSMLGKTVNIKVVSFNGVILLTGEAPSIELRNRAEMLAKPFRNVRKIYNEVRIAERISFDDNTHDAWLTSKVKTKLVGERGVITHTKVVTSNGIVYLMGLANQSEAEQARQLALDIEGVDNVVSLFEYPDGSFSALPKKPRPVTTTTPTTPPTSPEPAIDSAPSQTNNEMPADVPLPEEDDLELRPYVIQPVIQFEN